MSADELLAMAESVLPVGTRLVFVLDGVQYPVTDEGIAAVREQLLARPHTVTATAVLQKAVSLRRNVRTRGRTPGEWRMSQDTVDVLLAELPLIAAEDTSRPFTLLGIPVRVDESELGELTLTEREL